MAEAIDLDNNTQLAIIYVNVYAETEKASIQLDCFKETEYI